MVQSADYITLCRSKVNYIPSKTNLLGHNDECIYYITYIGITQQSLISKEFLIILCRPESEYTSSTTSYVAQIQNEYTQHRIPSYIL